MKKYGCFIFIMSLFACKDPKSAQADLTPKDSSNQSISKSEFDPVIDSLRSFKPALFSIPDERSDMDKIIPVGYNETGSFAYLHEKDMGGAVDYEFHIQPTYDNFEVMLAMDMEQMGDSVLDYHKDLVGQSLRSANIKLNNSIQRISLAELEKKYNIKFSSSKTWGAPHEDYADKKTLASIRISYTRGSDDAYPSSIVYENYPASWIMWDCYVSDIILVPSKELGMFGFAVLVTESAGFEGYTRKVIKLVNLGDVDG